MICKRSMDLYTSFVKHLQDKFPTRVLPLDIACINDIVQTLVVHPFEDDIFGIDNNPEKFHRGNFYGIITRENKEKIDFNDVKYKRVVLVHDYIRHYNSNYRKDYTERKIKELPENQVEFASYNDSNSCAICYAHENEDGTITPGKIFPNSVMGEIAESAIKINPTYNYKNQDYYLELKTHLTDHGLEKVLRHVDENSFRDVYHTINYDFSLNGYNFTLEVSKFWQSINYSALTAKIPAPRIQFLEYDTESIPFVDNDLRTLGIRQRIFPVFETKDNAKEVFQETIEKIMTLFKVLRDNVFERTFYVGVKKKNLQLALGFDDGLHLKPTEFDPYTPITLRGIIEEIEKNKPKFE